MTDTAAKYITVRDRTACMMDTLSSCSCNESLIWRGQIDMIETAEEALQIMGALE